MKKTFRRLKRLELVQLIYQLRKDNLKLKKRCRRLEKQLQAAEAQIGPEGGAALARIEQMLAELHRAYVPETAEEE